VWISSHAGSIFEPSPWRALQAAEACLRDARQAGDRQLEHWILPGVTSCNGGGSAMRRPKAGFARTSRPRSPRSTTLQAASAIQLARIASETGDPAALAEGARLMRLIAGIRHRGPRMRQGYLTRNLDHRRARALAQAWGVEDPTAALLSGS
jgi:hypothetical protein